MNTEFKPKVSIIIPVYNGENYLRESIDSALRQTYDNLEIIVVDDGSKDKTAEIAKSYGNKIRFFRKENGGTSTALNVGISHMTGEYFSWLSHDDMYYPDKIKRQIEELSKLNNKNTIMMTDLDGINENYEKIYQTNYIQHIKAYPNRERSYIHPIIYNQTHGCTLLIPKKCFEEVGLFDEKELVAQDFEFFYRAFLKFPHKLIPEVLVTARDSSNRQGRRSHNKGDEEYSRLFIKIIENLTEEDMNLLAPSRADFYADMKEFFDCAGYTIAYKYITEKMFSNLQISSYDLIGNKFNGHNLHKMLRDKGVDSKQVVWYKQSEDINTFYYDFSRKTATKDLISQKMFLDSDIIHLHMVHNIIDLNYLPIMTSLKPTVITLHDPFFLGGHCVHHFDCNSWKTHCADCRYLNKMFAIDNDYTALNFELKKNAIQNSNISAIVASKWMENKVKQSPIWENKKIYYLPFGTDQNIFKPAIKNDIRKELNINENNFVIMFREDSVSYKGLDIIKKALSKIKNRKNITIIAVGEEGLLEDFADKFNIIEYGWVTDDKKLAKLYQACDIFLMPSRQETFGAMAIEAMSCGKTVLSITGEGTALPEVINSPECGLAVDEKNFTQKLEYFIDNTNELKIRGEKSVKYAKQNYNRENYLNGMMNIYKDIIKNHHVEYNKKIVLEQLKKYSCNNLILEKNPEEKVQSKIMLMEPEKINVDEYILIKKSNIFVKIYRKIMPVKIRRKLKAAIIAFREERI